MKIFDILLKDNPRAVIRRMVSVVAFLIGQIWLYWAYEKTGQVIAFGETIFPLSAKWGFLRYLSTGLGLFGLLAVEINYAMAFEGEADAYLSILRIAYNTISLVFPFGAGFAYGLIGIICLIRRIYDLLNIPVEDSWLLYGTVIVFALGGWLLSANPDFSPSLSALVELWGWKDAWIVKTFPMIGLAIGAVGGFILCKWSIWEIYEDLIDETEQGVLIAFFALFSLLGGVYFMSAYVLLGLVFCVITIKSQKAAHIYLIVMLIALGVALLALYGTSCICRLQDYGIEAFPWWRLFQQLGLIK